MRTARDGAHELYLALRGEGGTIAAVLRDAVRDGEHRLDLDRPGPAQIAASGPRTTGRERDYELLLEMILEGARLHYREPVVVCPGDPDLGLLLGDQLYALGLTRLAALGDLDAIAELADVISIVAQAEAAGDGELAAAMWEAGAVAIGWGETAEHASAKALARAHDPAATTALRAAARAARRPVGSITS
jgi:hypothetical protein